MTLSENTTIKEWYMGKYINDELGEEIREGITFSGLFDLMDNYGNVYEYIGVDDSIIRERIFEGLSEVMKCDYEVVYEQWLKCRG